MNREKLKISACLSAADFLRLMLKCHYFSIVDLLVNLARVKVAFILRTSNQLFIILKRLDVFDVVQQVLVTKETLTSGFCHDKRWRESSSFKITKFRQPIMILCLHGYRYLWQSLTTSRLQLFYRQNGHSFRAKTGSLRKRLNDIAELHYVDSPLIASCTPRENEEPRSWWFSTDDGRFSSRDETDICTGFDSSLQSIVGLFDNEPRYDGLLGFSQGACMASLITSLMENGKFGPTFRFVILFSGFVSRSSKHKFIEDRLLATPSLHVVGETDAVIPKEMSLQLANMFSNPTIVYHDGGHYVPSNPALANAVKTFLKKFSESMAV
ncbi:serine hydrolase [Trichuris suis]|nr:serine hydrolase [Trichuris suis]